MSLAGARMGLDSSNTLRKAESDPMPRHVAIAAGGTAGHVTAGLAIAEAYQKAFDNVSVYFLGTPLGLESRLVPSSGYPLEIVSGTPIARMRPREKTRAVWDMMVGTAQARKVLRRHGTKLVIGFGGYASAGVLLAARSLGLRIAIHESNIVPGMTNRLLGRLAHRTYVGFDTTRRSIGGGEIRVTGNPVRSEIAGVVAQRRSRAETWMKPARVIVLGGSLGSRFLNHEAPKLLERVAKLGVALDVRHQTGSADSESVARSYQAAGISASVEPFISDMASTYQWADFAITSAGALTLAELAAAGLPSLLIPLKDSAGDHQVENAKAFAEATGGWWVSQSEWNPDLLAQRMMSLLLGVEEWESASKRVRELATPCAAKALVADCEELMSGHW